MWQRLQASHVCVRPPISLSTLSHSLTKFNLLISMKDFKPIWFQSMDITYFQIISSPKRFIFCIKYFWLHIIKIMDKVRSLMYNWTIFTCHRTIIDPNSNVYIFITFKHTNPKLELRIIVLSKFLIQSQVNYAKTPRHYL